MLTDERIDRAISTETGYVPESELRRLCRAIEAEVRAEKAEVPRKVWSAETVALHFGSSPSLELIASVLNIAIADAKRSAAPQPPAPCHDGMVDVTKEDAENYCRILTLLGMEEEGSPVEEVKRLVSLREGMVCADCSNTDWLENREEGRYPCTCMTEAEPYQLLQAKVAEQSQKYVKLQLTQAGIVAESKATITQLEEALSHATGGQYAQWQLDKADTQGKLIAKQLKIAEQSAEIERLTKERDYQGRSSAAGWRKCEELQSTIAQQAERIAELEQTIAMLSSGDTCARHCEGTAFRIEARRLKRWSDELRAALSGEHKDAARYRKVRLGRYWSVIDGIGNDLRGEALDAAADAAIAKDAP